MDNTGYQETQPDNSSSSLAKRIDTLEGQLSRFIDIQDKILGIMEIRHKATKKVFALHRVSIVFILVVQVLMALMVVYKF